MRELEDMTSRGRLKDLRCSALRRLKGIIFCRNESAQRKGKKCVLGGCGVQLLVMSFLALRSVNSPCVGRDVGPLALSDFQSSEEYSRDDLDGDDPVLKQTLWVFSCYPVCSDAFYLLPLGQRPSAFIGTCH